MNSILRSLGVVVIFAVFIFVSDPKMFTKHVRDLVGPETPSAEQIRWKEMSEQFHRNLQSNPPVIRHETPEWIKKELNK
jgi:hypothetical protein